MSNLEFAVGKRVVCIRDDFGSLLFNETAPTKGSIYTIRNIEPGRRTRNVYLRFEEIINPAHDYGYAIIEASFIATAFRPVRETSIDCFTALLEKPPVRQTEDA